MVDLHHSENISSCKVALRGHEPEYETSLNEYSRGICHHSKDGSALETPVLKFYYIGDFNSYHIV